MARPLVRIGQHNETCYDEIEVYACSTILDSILGQQVTQIKKNLSSSL